MLEGKKKIKVIYEHENSTAASMLAVFKKMPVKNPFCVKV